MLAWSSKRATRLLHFAGERNSWTVGLVELKAVEEVAHAIDLLAWAADPVNDADPLTPGEYALTATRPRCAAQPGAGRSRLGRVASSWRRSRLASRNGPS